jgi:hypothetical protein
MGHRWGSAKGSPARGGPPATRPAEGSHAQAVALTAVWPSGADSQST